MATMLNQVYKTYSIRRRGSMEKHVDSIHFQHFSPFFFIIFMTNYPFEKY